MHPRFVLAVHSARFQLTHLSVSDSPTMHLRLSTSSTFSRTPTLLFRELINFAITSAAVSAYLPLPRASPRTMLLISCSDGRAYLACGYALYAGPG